MVDSVSFLLGGRADRGIIREGAPKAYVEGAFSVEGNEDAQAVLEELAQDVQEGEVLLSRELSAAGKSVCRVGGIAVSLTVLRRLAETLMDIHGQHEHQSLLNEASHLAFLDEMGESSHHALLNDVRQAWSVFDSSNRALRDLERQNDQRQERMLALNAREEELSAARVLLGEEDQLRKRLDHLRNFDRIVRQLQAAYAACYDSRGDEPAALALVKRGEEALRGIAHLDEGYHQAHERLEALYYELEDLGLELRAAWEGLDADEGALQQTAERLDLIRRLCRKHGLSADELPQALKEARRELERFSNLEEELLTLRERTRKAEDRLRKAADLLTRSREELAHSLSQRMEQELEDLNMQGTRVNIAVEPRGQIPSASGQDQVRILIAPNVGEALKPLTRIASGGEISRLMLALKSISAEHNVIPSMIFDEIDTGISGRTAQVVAEKLWQIARYRQVFCVTHLQQIAAMASTQYLVEKGTQGQRTLTTVSKMEEDQRLGEISRIISGRSPQSDSSLAHARTMLKEAALFRAAHPG